MINYFLQMYTMDCKDPNCVNCRQAPGGQCSVVNQSKIQKTVAEVVTTDLNSASVEKALCLEDCRQLKEEIHCQISALTAVLRERERVLCVQVENECSTQMAKIDRDATVPCLSKLIPNSEPEKTPCRTKLNFDSEFHLIAQELTEFGFLSYKNPVKCSEKALPEEFQKWEEQIEKLPARETSFGEEAQHTEKSPKLRECRYQAQHTEQSPKLKECRSKLDKLHRRMAQQMEQLTISNESSLDKLHRRMAQQKEQFPKLKEHCFEYPNDEVEKHQCTVEKMASEASEFGKLNAILNLQLNSAFQQMEKERKEAEGKVFEKKSCEDVANSVSNGGVENHISSQQFAGRFNGIPRDQLDKLHRRMAQLKEEYPKVKERCFEMNSIFQQMEKDMQAVQGKVFEKNSCEDVADSASNEGVENHISSLKTAFLQMEIAETCDQKLNAVAADEEVVPAFHSREDDADSVSSDSVSTEGVENNTSLRVLLEAREKMSKQLLWDGVADSVSNQGVEDVISSGEDDMEIISRSEAASIPSESFSSPPLPPKNRLKFGRKRLASELSKKELVPDSREYVKIPLFSEGRVLSFRNMMQRFKMGSKPEGMHIPSFGEVAAATQFYSKGPNVATSESSVSSHSKDIKKRKEVSSLNEQASQGSSNECTVGSDAEGQGHDPSVALVSSFKKYLEKNPGAEWLASKKSPEQSLSSGKKCTCYKLVPSLLEDADQWLSRKNKQKMITDWLYTAA